jgi:hypothetical protein
VGAKSGTHALDAYVVLPTLNEEEGLAKTYSTIPLEALRSVGLRVGVVVIDGGSKDRTLEVARSLGLTVIHQQTRGKGAAVREALEWVAGQGVRYALVMDADCTYPPEMIGPGLSLLKAGGELVVGVRNPVNRQPIGLRDLVHRIGNALLNWMASQSTGQPILDLCSGFYAIDLATGLHEGLTATGFEIESEMFLKAHRRGLQVIQIPIAYRERVGTAKLRAVHDGGRIFVSIVRSRLGGRLLAPPPPGGHTLARELLSACFVHGSREVVILADPSRLDEAHTLVRELASSPTSHALVVAEPRAFADYPAFALEEGTASAWPGAAVLHLAARASSDVTSSPMAVYLPNTHRFIRLELDRTLAAPSSEPTTPGFLGSSRSGARPLPSRVSRYLNSLSTLGSAIDKSGVRKELTLHGANGLHGRPVPVDSVPNSPSPSFHALGPEDRSTGGSST